jgi:hypothetical protein
LRADWSAALLPEEFFLRVRTLSGNPPQHSRLKKPNARPPGGLKKKGETKMANVYIEPRPKGRPEGDPIDDYVVEDHADHVLAPTGKPSTGRRRTAIPPTSRVSGT